VFCLNLSGIAVCVRACTRVRQLVGRDRLRLYCEQHSVGLEFTLQSKRRDLRIITGLVSNVSVLT
jgi:hypothetical protein